MSRQIINFSSTSIIQCVRVSELARSFPLIHWKPKTKNFTTTCTVYWAYITQLELQK